MQVALGNAFHVSVEYVGHDTHAPAPPTGWDDRTVSRLIRPNRRPFPRRTQAKKKKELARSVAHPTQVRKKGRSIKPGRSRNLHGTARFLITCAFAIYTDRSNVMTNKYMANKWFWISVVAKRFCTTSSLSTILGLHARMFTDLIHRPLFFSAGLQLQHS